jgi:hypothetical protein
LVRQARRSASTEPWFGGRSFTACQQLGERFRRYDGSRRGVADRLALYRAFQTVAVEFAECSDDFYGNIGDLRFDAFETYVSIDWASTDLAAEHYWQDLCEMLVSLVYALTVERETLPFPRADAGQAEMIETVLVGLAQEHRAAYQNFQADQALELIAWLHLAGSR